MRPFAGMLAAVLLAGSLASAQTQPCATPGNNNDFLGIQTIRLWPGDAPEAKGKACEDTPTLTIFEPRARQRQWLGCCDLPWRRLSRAGRQPGGPRSGRLVHGAGLSRLHAQLPALLERLPAAGTAARCPARHPDGAGAGGGLPYRPQPHRRHRLFGRRPPGGACRNAVCARQSRGRGPHRSRLQPTGLPGAGLPVDRRHLDRTPRT